MRSSICNAFRFLCLSGAFLLLGAAACRAQFSRLDDPAVAENSVSPFATLFESLNNLIYTGTDYNTIDQTWDPTARHYRGNLLHYIHYPELSGTDHRQFSLIKLSGDSRLLAGYEGSAASLIEQTEQLAGRDNHRVKMNYHFDTSGWLRAIITKSIYPEYEGYAEKSDSLFYSFDEGGPVQIRWVQDEWSSGTGSSTSECGPLPAFFQIIKHVVVNVSLDSFHNITTVESRTEEQWDTCKAGGPKYWKRAIQYDAEGKPLRITITESNGKYAGTTSDCSISYEALSPDAFRARVKDRPSYEPFRDPTLKAYMDSQPGLTCIAQHKVITTYLRYNSSLRNYAIRTDSPYVNADTGYFFFNPARRQRIAATLKAYQAIYFYRRSVDSATGAPFVTVQSLKMLPDVNPAGTVVCNPVVYNSTISYGALTTRTNTGILSFYLSDERKDNSGNYYPANTAAQTTIHASQPLRQYVRSMAYTDGGGLLRYLWLPNSSYKLVYP